jgi:peptidoglycan/xylan/chitin deacetylase (PgdA/CDA1 family)
VMSGDRGNGVRILCYHGVNERPTSSFEVAAADFEKQMRYLSERYTAVSLEEVVEALGGDGQLPGRPVSVTIDDGYRDAYTHAYPVLRELSIPATMFLPVEFIGTSSKKRVVNRLPGSNFLSWEQVREMGKNGISFGSHTMSHLSLTRLTKKEVKYQLESSRGMLEAEVGAPVMGLSYPYGTVRDFNTEIQRLAAAAGYSWAVTGISGLNHPNSNLFALRRTKVERDDGMRVFVRAMKGALDLWVIVDKLGWFLQGKNR